MKQMCYAIVCINHEAGAQSATVGGEKSRADTSRWSEEKSVSEGRLEPAYPLFEKAKFLRRLQKLKVIINQAGWAL